MRGKILAILVVAAMFGSLAIFVMDGEAENSGEISKEFSISNLVFCSEKSKSYMDYVEQPGATYKPGDVVWIYMNLDGLKLNPNSDGANEMWIGLYVTLKSPNGGILLNEATREKHGNVQMNQDEICLDAYINTTPQLAEGKYVIEIIVKDKLGDRRATASDCFLMNNGQF